MTDEEAMPLSGRVVGVTAERRKGELTALLARAGASVIEAPAMRLVPIEDDTEARAATEACLAAPVDYAVAMTGVGFRGWLAAADTWGLGEHLRGTLADAEILARGPKARGAIRGAGLAESWHAKSEASDEVLAHLLTLPLAGRRVAVQLHGEPLPDFVRPLRAAGADVIEVPLYRWEPPVDVAPVRELIAALVNGGVSAVAFTSGPQVHVLFDLARESGHLPEVIDALRHSVLPAVIGPVCARPLQAVGIEAVWPERFRLADLARLVIDELSVPSPA
ncbi:MAG: uroporphyrinogen-III synthase [Frankiaceae bacterium]|jgi:uroporphyrinogen-III synthase|nr:uroporphyrinogen-III synthase [Frankiaceae bacterium]